MTKTLSRDLISKTEWIEMFPFGVAMGANQARPVMIFKDKAERRVLPIWLSHLDAGIAVTQNAARLDGSPHELSWKILSILGVKLEKCIFKDVKGNHQFVELHFVGSKKLKVLESRADDAISFCLRSGCKFFATIDYIDQSRVLEGEIVHSMVSQKPEVNPHPYLN